MNNVCCKAISSLLNERNNLPKPVAAHSVLEGNYFYISKNVGEKEEEVLACVRAKCMSFFCYELKHLCVKKGYEKNGLASKMVDLVEDFVRQKGVPMLMATTRSDNTPVINLFNKKGFIPTKEFVNNGTKHPLILWRKELV